MIKKILTLLLAVAVFMGFGTALLCSDDGTAGGLASSISDVDDANTTNDNIYEDELTAEQAAALWDYLDLQRFGETAVLADVVAPEFKFNVKSVVLTEAITGTVLYEYQKDEQLAPASVTKIMSLLLIMEAYEAELFKLEDMVTTSEHAASMGGTQIYLEVGESMTANDLIKAITVPSANDATVAMAEFIAGSEEEFVRRMNERAKELGMVNTLFKNSTGLFDDAEHKTTAFDIALMTRELLKHKKIYDYSTIWMDTVRNGSFGLANTNKMLRTYSGMTGMKTGYTKESRYCFSGTAERNGMTLIVTVMGAETSPDRFMAASKLLDFGFASYALAKSELEELPLIPVNKGKEFLVEAEVLGSLAMVVPKGQEKLIETSLTLAESIDAPAEKGRQIGVLVYKIKDEVVKNCSIVLKYEVLRADMGDYWGRMIKKLLN